MFWLGRVSELLAAGPAAKQPHAMLAGQATGTGRRLRVAWGAPFGVTHSEEF